MAVGKIRTTVFELEEVQSSLRCRSDILHAQTKTNLIIVKLHDHNILDDLLPISDDHFKNFFMNG